VSTIHDLGYKRYVGTRRDPSTRWRVIARHQVAMAWKTWWRYKAALGMAVIVTCIAGGMMVFASERRTSLGAAQVIVMKLADSALPEAIIWFCRAGFLVSLTIGAGIVASDVETGAFTFYFARSMKPLHYVLGKLAGLCVLLAFIVLAGPLILAGLRLGISEDLDEVLAVAPIMWKAAVIGLLSIAAYAAVPFGFSALMSSRKQALALWAAYYLVVGEMAHRLGIHVAGWIAAIDLPRAIQAVTYYLFDLHFRPMRDAEIPLWAAFASLGAHIAFAIAAVAYQVRAAQKSGVGGSS
jgi:hypothetical protein